MSLKSVLVICTIMVVLCCLATEGRYLPTRSDDSRKDEIREILREIFENTADRKDFAKRFLIRRSTNADGSAPMDNYESS